MENSLIYFDVGAYGEKQFPFNNKENIKYLKEYIGIDPRFEDEVKIEGKYIYYSCAIFDEEVEKIFYVTLDGVSSSLFPTDVKFTKNYLNPQGYSTINTPLVKCKKISTLIKQHGDDIDILKLDTHGSEYNILKELEVSGYLKRIVAIQVETWIVPVHISTILWDKIHELLTSYDFYLATVAKKKHWADLLYINAKTTKSDKMKLIKEFYKVEDREICRNNRYLNNIINQIEGRENLRE